MRLGAVSGVDSGTRGTTYFDAFESRRSSTIGQQGGLRGFELGKVMRKGGLAKGMAVRGEQARLALVGDGELTDYLFAGQRYDSYINLYWVESRWYDGELGRFIQPDPIIPEPYNPQAYDRYQCVYSNPVRYTDSSGHCIDGISTVACAIFIGGVVLKAIDYGWTAYDAWKAGKTLADPYASQEAKDAAMVDLALAAGFEAMEPDELLPIGLPVDDLARKGLINIGKEVGEEAGEQAFRSFTRWNFRENLRRLTGKGLDDIVGMEAHHVLPQALEDKFIAAGIKDIHNPIYGSWVDAATHRRWSSGYNARWKEFLRIGRTKKEILDFARKLSKEYKFNVHFGNP